MKRVLWILLGLTLVASVVADFVGPSKEVSHVWDYKAFFALYGFLGCVVIVYVSKWLGKHWLQRPEDYYDGEPPPWEPNPDGGSGGANV